MRFRVRYRYPPAPRPVRLYLLLPPSKERQRITKSTLSKPATAVAGFADVTLACFELGQEEALELSFELEGKPATGPATAAGEAAAELVANVLENASEDWRGVAAPEPETALQLALAVREEAAKRGWRADVVLGHLLLTEPQKHAWNVIHTPHGSVELDALFYQVMQNSPAYWLAYGLAPAPEDYLSGHEGRRLAWGTAPLPAKALPCTNEEDALASGERWYFFWPDAIKTDGGELLEPVGRTLSAEPPGSEKALVDALAALRVTAFAALVLVALGFARPGGWPLLAYGTYAALLALGQGRAALALFARPRGWRVGLEIVLFHLAFLATVTGAQSVLPQTLFVLYWIYNRLEPYLMHKKGRTGNPAGPA